MSTQPRARLDPPVLDARRRHKLRQHAASLATGAIVFFVAIGLMQAARHPAASTVAVTQAASPAPQQAPPSVSENATAATTDAASTVAVTQAASPAPQQAPLGVSGNSAAAATAAGSEESSPVPAPAAPRAASPSTPAPSTAVQIMGMPSVYIHVLNESARDQARLLAPELEKRGIALAGIKVVSAGPRSSDLRYFRPSEKQEAMQVQAALLSLGLPARKLKSIAGFETSAVPRQYELWLAADFKG